MDMKQLTTFTTLAITLNYQKAADQLQYAPSTLFKHIQLLEQELGVDLFVKQGRQLHLTPEGETFRAHAENILESYRNAVHSISACDIQESSLTIGGCEINTGNSLLSLFAQFSQLYPQARMSMLTSPNASVPQLVRSDLIDLGFYYTIDGETQHGLEMTRLYRQPIYLLAAREHPIHAKANPTFEDLRGMPFVYPHDTCCFVCEMLPILHKRGTDLGRITYLGSMQLVAEHAHSEQALTLMPYCAVEHFCTTHDMRVIDLGEPLVWAWNTLLYKSLDSLRPLARALLRQSVEYAQRRVREDGMLLGG